MRRWLLLALCIAPVLLRGQTPSDQKPLAFDVVSVKPNTSGDISVSMAPSPGGVERELQAQDSQLAAEIANEQNRWQDFNNRLDDLEKSLTR